MQLRLLGVYLDNDFDLNSSADASRTIAILLYLKDSIPTLNERKLYSLAKTIMVDTASIEESFKDKSPYQIYAEIILYENNDVTL